MVLLGNLDPDRGGEIVDQGHLVSAKLSSWIVRAGLIMVLLVAFGARLVYALNISPFSDEYITMMASRAVTQIGAPILPSGLFYDHGISFVYLDALFLGLMGFTMEIARMASVFVGMLAIALTYVVGRRWFAARAGFIAALLLTLDSVTIIWHSRARMYSVLQLGLLAAVFLFYEGFVRQDSRLYRCVGMIALGAAGLAHLLAIPYAATTIAALVIVRWWVRKRGGAFPLCVWRLWPELLLGLIGWGMVLFARLLGGPWGAGGRIVTDTALLLDVGYLVTHGLAWMKHFLTWPNLVWAALILAGMLLLLMRKADRRDDPPWCYLMIIWLGSVVGLGVFSRWYGSNYIVGLTPFFYLLSARELDGLCSAIERASSLSNARRMVWVCSVAVIILALFLAWPGVLETVTHDPVQLDQALHYVHQRLQNGDVVATYAPPVSLVALGRVDFYALEYGNECIETEAGRVDIWTGSPVLDSVERLGDVLNSNERVWLIVDRESWDWQRHYSDAYRTLAETRMVRVFDGTGTMVYLSEP